MRALMTAGPALERDNIAGYNCFSGTEKYLTHEGIKSFYETVGTTQYVLSGRGEWVKADIKSFGIQKLNRVTFRPGDGRSSIRHSVLVTKNHRWITEKGQTTSLQVGDVVSFVSKPLEEKIDEAFIRGFAFGDGTLDARGRLRIRLCGKKNELLHYFQRFGHSSIMSPPSFDGDNLIVFHKGWLIDSKSIPKNKDSVWLNSWLEGYLSADGHNNPTQPGLSSQDHDAIEFVKEIAPLAGYCLTGDTISSSMETNYGERSAPLRRITLRREGFFRVVSIEEDVDEQEVFCAVVPKTADFTLANGIHTGNCSYIPIQDLKAFDEVMYILMNGVGVGYSIESKYVERLPQVPELFEETLSKIVVEDSKQGWAKAFRELLSILYSGGIPSWDLSKLRPAGARLKVFGGRSSGPRPLDDLFRFTVQLITGAKGRRLSTVEASDLVCKIASIVVVGGVRRSALICLSDLNDEGMRHYKSGQWWVDYPQRALANISATYTTTPDAGTFLREWTALYDSKSGERGIFNRNSATKQAKATGRREVNHEWGVNPCGEIILRPFGYCNLSEVIVRSTDTFETLSNKVKIATIIGTFQSTLTDFKYIRKEWKKNAEEERLLGVSMTGIMDHEFLNGTLAYMYAGDYAAGLEAVLSSLKQTTIETNKEWATKLGINQSVAITTVNNWRL